MTGSDKDKALVVNVDDLGLHPAVNRFVLEASRLGTISSASLLANGTYLDDAVALTGPDQVRNLGIGVHLNVLRGKPVSPPDTVPSLLGPDGTFHGRISLFVWQLAAGRIALSEVEREWRAQIELILDLGIRPSHVDSEKHTHAIPGLFSLASRLTSEYGISWIRRPQEEVWPALRRGKLKPAVLAGLMAMNRRSSCIRSADSIWGIANAGAHLSSEGLSDHLRRRAGADVIEVICHPGLPQASDPSLEGMGNISVADRWAIEADTVLSDGWNNVVRNCGRRLKSFQDLESAN